MSNNEKRTYIGFICRMLERCDIRRIKIIYEFVLGLTA